MAAPSFVGRCCPQLTLTPAHGRHGAALSPSRGAFRACRRATGSSTARRAFSGTGGFLEPDEFFWKDTLESQLQELDSGAYSHPSSSGSSSISSDDDAASYESWEAGFPAEDEPVTLRRLRAAISNLTWSSEAAHVSGAPAAPAPARSLEVHVILFGVGQSELEGIYSLRASARDGSLPVDTIVAFAARDDATRYATLLEATMEHEPTVFPLAWGDLLDFCSSSGYRCRLEAKHSLLIPPDANVGVTDWEKSLRLRQGRYAVLRDEPGTRGDALGVPGEENGLDAASPPLSELDGFFVPPPGAAGGALRETTYHMHPQGGDGEDEDAAGAWHAGAVGGRGEREYSLRDLQVLLRAYRLSDPRILETCRASLEAVFARGY